MKKTIRSFFGSSSVWLELCFAYAWAGIVVILNISWGLLFVFAILSGMIWVCSIKHKADIHSSDELIHFEKRIRKSLKTIEKTGDVSRLYRILDTEILPEVRKHFPQKIYKYYSLSDDPAKNHQKLEAVERDQIWASLYSEFNDPYECQYMYLNQADLEELGFPPQSKKIWDALMEEIRQRITTICFTQNPNDMPMWAHYANEHKGFCVEYKIDILDNLYPVFYVEKRLKAQALFINLVYAFFNQEVTSDERRILLKHIILMSAFKDNSWSSENEIRAIFLNPKSDINKGKLFSCKEIGIHPTKIYIGAKCDQDYSQALFSIAQTMQIDCERCILSTDETFSVIGSSN